MVKVLGFQLASIPASLGLTVGMTALLGRLGTATTGYTQLALLMLGLTWPLVAGAVYTFRASAEGFAILAARRGSPHGAHPGIVAGAWGSLLLAIATLAFYGWIATGVYYFAVIEGIR